MEKNAYGLYAPIDDQPLQSYVSCSLPVVDIEAGCDAAEFIREISVRPMSDIDLAEAWVRWQGGRFLYNNTSSRWMQWGGATWAECARGEVANSVIEFSRWMQGAASRREIPGSSSAVLKGINWLGSRDHRETLTKTAASFTSVSCITSDFDNQGNLLNLENCALDLDSMKALPRTRGMMFSRKMNTSFDGRAECPNWERMISHLFTGDTGMIRYFQRWVGYMLTDKTSEQSLLFLQGLPETGKSRVIAALLGMFGSYAAKIPAFVLLNGKSNDRMQGEMARLNKLRLVISTELSENGEFDDTLLKDMTGSDSITARELYHETFCFKPIFKLLIYGNNKPKVVESQGLWRRLKIVPCNNPYQVGERIPDHIVDSTIASEFPGVLNWALAGLHRWKTEGGLGEAPKIIKEVTEAYKQESDLISQFIKERLILTMGGHRTQLSSIYREYSHWCEEIGIKRPYSRPRFQQKLEAHRIVPIEEGDYGAIYENVIIRQLT